MPPADVLRERRGDAPIPVWRAHGPFLLVLALAAALRLPALGWLPSPAGDEGNWATYGLLLSRGQPAALAPDASFVSLLYAHLISVSIRVLGPGFAAARAVGAVAVMVAIAGAYGIFGWLGSRRAGLVAATLLAVHPWSVAYSRTASVPYALALAAMTLGPLLFAAGLARRRSLVAAAGLLLSSVAVHFSPLVAVAAAACLLHGLAAPNRWALKRPAVLVACLLAALHGAPVVLGAIRVARTAPDLRSFESFWAHLGQYLHMMGTGLMGEATVRHFTNLALPPRFAALLWIPLVILVATAGRTARRGPLNGFGLLYLVTAFAVAPLILAPGRNWNLPANHMDRYLFAVLPGFVLLLAEASARGTARFVAALAVLAAWLLVGGTGRLGWGLMVRGGVDHGEGVFDGGSGYRGWLISDQPRSTLEQIRAAVLAEGGAGRGALLVADRTFIPLGFALEGTGIPVFDVRRTTIPPREDGLYFVLLWPDHVLAVGDPPTAPPKYVESNRRLRERMDRLFRRTRLVRVLRQPDGSPLLEIWRAEDPLPRLRLESRPPEPPGTEDRERP